MATRQVKSNMPLLKDLMETSLQIQEVQIADAANAIGQLLKMILDDDRIGRGDILVP